MHTTYLNTAAAGLMSAETLNACVQHLGLEQDVGAYLAQNMRQAELNCLGLHAARLLNCQPSEFSFTDSGTRAWHKAVESVNLQREDVVLVSPAIWGGNYFTLLQFEKHFGVRLLDRFVADNFEG